MGLDIVDFEAKHARELMRAGAEASYFAEFGENIFDHLEGVEYCYTGVFDDKILFCTGLVPLGPHKAEAWTLFRPNSKKDFSKTFYAVRRLLMVAPFDRIEARIRCDNAPAHRWIKLLGFQLEAERMRKSSIFGHDESLYSRVRDGR